jgi:DNA-binding MarR family transcriptional regulator
MSYITEITKLFKDEFKANIMFILDIFGPLNLETLHNLLRKPKSTIFGHLKEMVELDQIEIDSKLTAEKTGKYYTLTPYIKELFNKEEDNITLKENTLNELGIPKEEFAKSIANVQRSIGFQTNLFSQLSAQYLEDHVDLFDNVQKNKEHLHGFFAGAYELLINSKEEYDEVQETFREFNKKLKKFDKSKRKTGKQTLLIFTLGVPKDKLGPK